MFKKITVRFETACFSHSTVGNTDTGIQFQTRVPLNSGTKGPKYTCNVKNDIDKTNVISC